MLEFVRHHTIGRNSHCSGSDAVSPVSTSGIRNGGYLNDGYSVGDVGWLLENYETAARSFHDHPDNKPPGGVAISFWPQTAVRNGPNEVTRATYC